MLSLFAAHFLRPPSIAIWFCILSLIFRRQLMSPLHLWIKVTVIKLAFTLFHVCPGPPSPLSSQGHISEFFISMLAKMGKRKLLNLGLVGSSTNLMDVFYVSDVLASRDYNHRNFGTCEELFAPDGICLGYSHL